MDERNKEVKSPPDNYSKFNNYINKKANNLIKSHTYSHDYKSPKNYPYKNGNIMNNYDNFDLNIINDNYDNGINYYNKENSIKMNIIQNEYNNNILSKSSNNYMGGYSSIFMNKKNNSMSNNIRINKTSREFSNLKDSNKEKNIQILDKNGKNCNNGMRSKPKSKSKYQSTSNVLSNEHEKKIRNKSARNNIKFNKYYNNELIDNMDKYNEDNFNNNYNLEERYFIKYLNNKIDKNKNGNFSGAKSYSNMNKNYFYDSTNKNKNEYNNREYLNQNSLSLKNIKTYKDSDNDNDNLIYNKNNKTINKNIEDVNGINFNNINIGINNNNFIIDNDKRYQTYNGSFRSKTLKVNHNDILEINDIKKEDLLKTKNKNPINKRKEFIKGKYIIETEDDRFASNNNRNMSKPKNTNNFYNENIMKNKYLYNANNISDDKDLNYNRPISGSIYRMPLNYSQSIHNNNGSNKYGTNIELKNYLKSTRTFNNTSNSKKSQEINNSSINNNYELYDYNVKTINMYENSPMKNKSKNVVTNPVIKNRDSNHNPFNTIYKSQRIYKYENGINNSQRNSLQHRNNFKNEKINNKNNLDTNLFKGNYIDYHTKLDLIKNRTKNLLNMYSNLLKQKIIFSINESIHNNIYNH